MKKRSLLFIIFLFLCLSSSFYYILAEEKSTTEKNGKEEPCACPVSLGQAPNFNLKDLEGKEVKLSDFKGKGVILYFWATWCPICTNYLHELNVMYPMLKEKNIEFLAIGMGETANRVKRYMKKNPINFPVLLDTNGKVTQSYVVFGPPTFILIDKSGYIRFQNNFWPRNYEEYICE